MDIREKISSDNYDIQLKTFLSGTLTANNHSNTAGVLIMFRALGAIVALFGWSSLSFASNYTMSLKCDTIPTYGGYHGVVAEIKAKDGRTQELIAPFDLILSTDLNYKKKDAKVTYVDTLTIFLSAERGQVDAIMLGGEARIDGFISVVSVPHGKSSVSVSQSSHTYWVPGKVTVGLNQHNISCIYKYL